MKPGGVVTSYGASRGMLILGMDGSMARPSAAVAKEGKVIHQISSAEAGAPSRDILRLAERALAASSVTIRDVGLIAVTVGPGSFTGVRAAMAAAMGLSAGCGAPVAGVRTLEAVAACSQAVSGRVTAVSPARKGTVYVSEFEMTPGGPVELSAPVEEPMGGDLVAGPPAGDAPTVAASAALIAGKRAARGEKFVFPPAPEYVGRPQAEELLSGKKDQTINGR